MADTSKGLLFPSLRFFMFVFFQLNIATEGPGTLQLLKRCQSGSYFGSTEGNEVNERLTGLCSLCFLLLDLWFCSGLVKIGQILSRYVEVDHVLHPVSAFAVELLHDGDVRYSGGCGGAMANASHQAETRSRHRALSWETLSLCFFRRPGEKGLTTIFQIKTFTAIGLFEQAFHFPRIRDQIVHFGYLALREYLPAVECRDPLAESVE
jgi:hypothetical protein